MIDVIFLSEHVCSKECLCCISKSTPNQWLRQQRSFDVVFMQATYFEGYLTIWIDSEYYKRWQTLLFVSFHLSLWVHHLSVFCIERTYFQLHFDGNSLMFFSRLTHRLGWWTWYVDFAGRWCISLSNNIRWMLRSKPSLSYINGTDSPSIERNKKYIIGGLMSDL